jgi:copper chaperone CopZ
MKKLVLSAAVVALVWTASASAESIKLRLDGVKCDQCADEIISVIEKVPTAKLKTKPSKATPEAVLDLDTAKSDVGVLGKAVAGADTPHKGEEAPAAYLLIDAPGITDANNKKLEMTLKGVKGVNAALSSGSVKKKVIEVRLDDSGAAKMADIKKALADYTKK